MIACKSIHRDRISRVWEVAGKKISGWLLFFSLTAPWKSCQEGSLTGDKWFTGWHLLSHFGSHLSASVVLLTPLPPVVKCFRNMVSTRSDVFLKLHRAQRCLHNKKGTVPGIHKSTGQSNSDSALLTIRWGVLGWDLFCADVWPRLPGKVRGLQIRA